MNHSGGSQTSVIGARRRSPRDIAVGVGALALLAVVALLVLAIAGLLVWAFFDSEAWKPILGFAIAATVIAAVSLGIRGIRP